MILEGFVLPFVLKWMAASALPVDLDLTGISTLRGLLDFLAVPDGLWTAFVQQVGDPGHHRLIAALPKSVIIQGAVQASVGLQLGSWLT